MSTHRISIDTPDVGQSIIDLINGKANDTDTVARIASWLQGIAVGSKTAKLRWNGGAVQAAGTITFASFIADDTVTINGNVLTAKASPSGASQFALGSSDQDCANNLAAKINASALAKIVGCVGASRRATVLLSSFVAGGTVTVNGVVFTGKASPNDAVREEFAIGATDALSAQNLCNAINRSQFSATSGVVATVSSATVTLNYIGTLTVSISANGTATSTIVVVTCLIPGQIGNLCTLAISARGSVSAANLASGTEGTEVIFAGKYQAV